MATAQDHIGYRTYGFRDLFADLLTGFSSPSDDGYAVAIVVGSRTWRVRTVFSTRESARSVGSNAPGFSDSSAAFTHDASDPSLMPNDRATSTRVRSELRNSATASRRNSSGLLRWTTHWGLLPPERSAPESGVQQSRVNSTLPDDVIVVPESDGTVVPDG